MNTLTPKTPWHLWVIGVIALLWNAGGVTSYMMTELGMLEQLEMPADQTAYFYGFPAWAVAFWALGVWGSLLGSLCLLLRRKWAVMLYGISLVGLLGTTYYQQFVDVVPESMQTTGQILFAVAIWAITIALFFYARAMASKGVLR